ncbi:unnamed protein product [Cyclocybe aegerita]|uniref:Protein kinase domain-containing protein n=1 Tax=Cyclocybe aegerita TaxID=1973307 RepID=A0A8S0X158_CYCAE|nr:unnamed protein product [Cyclocybe aegerita]
MTPALKYALAPYGKAFLGDGGYSVVFKATEEGSGKQVAIKKSRISKKVKRSFLQHEIRVLQLLQGQASIPAVYAYGRLPHFEYMAMELLGPSVAQMLKEGAGLLVETVIQVVDQTLMALKHIHSL